MKSAEVAGRVLDSNPEHARWTFRWEDAAAVDGKFDWRDTASCSLRCSRELFNLLDRNIAEEFERQVKILFTTPARANFGKFDTKTVDVIFDMPANVAREFDGDEHPPGLFGKARH